MCLLSSGGAELARLDRLVSNGRTTSAARAMP
jgi:hypothetical protein